jgi:hypothetical protein
MERSAATRSVLRRTLSPLRDCAGGIVVFPRGSRARRMAVRCAVSLVNLLAGNACADDLVTQPLQVPVNTFTSHFERRVVTPAEQSGVPFNGVLKLIGRYDSRLGRPQDLDCSAPIVSDHLIVANAHCVVAEGRYVRALSAFVGFRHTSYVHEFVPRLIWRGAMSSQRKAADDIVLLAVKEPFPPGLARFQADASDAGQRVGTVQFVGYSRDVERGRVLLFAPQCRNHLELRFMLPGFDIVECDFTETASSAPLFYEATNASGRPEFRLVAIVAGGVSATRYNIPFSAQTANVGIAATNFYGQVIDFEREIREGREVPTLATFSSVLPSRK